MADVVEEEINIREQRGRCKDNYTGPAEFLPNA
jgi:hypothetical protein